MFLSSSRCKITLHLRLLCSLHLYETPPIIALFLMKRLPSTAKRQCLRFPGTTSTSTGRCILLKIFVNARHGKFYADDTVSQHENHSLLQYDRMAAVNFLAMKKISFEKLKFSVYLCKYEQ